MTMYRPVEAKQGLMYTKKICSMLAARKAVWMEQQQISSGNTPYLVMLECDCQPAAGP